MVNTSYSNTTTQILKVKTEQVAYRQLGDVKILHFFVSITLQQH